MEPFIYPVYHRMESRLETFFNYSSKATDAIYCTIVHLNECLIKITINAIHLIAAQRLSHFMTRPGRKKNIIGVISTSMGVRGEKETGLDVL